MNTIPIACDMNTLPDRKQHEATSAQLMPQAQAVAALPDGFTVAFPVAALSRVAAFVDGERRCCPFLHFVIEVAPAAEGVQLHLRGGEGVKAFLERELLPMLPVEP
ncbi:MAG: hypothetical protein AAFV33_16970 [Chloroflexota bacterium]